MRKPVKVDKHVLYEASVQGTEIDIGLIARIYRRWNGRAPLTLREDFCGTGLLAYEWARSRADRRAWGVDLHGPTLAWSARHRRPCYAAESGRVELREENVLETGCPPVDVVAALNFSYMIFKDREVMKAYFTRVAEGLTAGGLFLLDLFGGPHSQDVMTESKEVPAGVDAEGVAYPAFTYVWDQAAFNAVDQNIVCHIHFRGKGIVPVERAFTYDWRLWSITEIRDLLLECGFEGIEPYFEGWSDAHGSTDGKLRLRREYREMSAWVAYLGCRKRG